MAFSKHETAIVESSSIGDGTFIQAFVHVLEGARIGHDCQICDHALIENDVIIGDRVTVKSGVQLCDGMRVEDDVFIGTNASFSNDAFPRSRQAPEIRLATVIRKGASVGANATVMPGVTVGERVMVSAGAVVTHDVPRDAVVSGNPAQIVGYVGAAADVRPLAPTLPSAVAEPTQVEGVVFQRLPFVEDLRGNLSFGEVARQVPFEVKRYFLVFQVPSEEVRGEHAHRAQHQFLVCVTGRCSVVADDGVHRQEFVLDAPNIGLYLPPMTWAVQYKYTREAVLMALVSDKYDPADYIRDYPEFLALKGLAQTSRP